MNFRLVIHNFALLLLGLAAVMLGLAVAFFGIESLLAHQIRPQARLALVISAGTGLLAGGALWFATRKPSPHLGRREALLLVAASWVFGAAFAALPFLLWAHLSGADSVAHPFRRFVDCYFEAMSGMTTTGATVLTDIESLPRSLLLWRATLHWLGGLGIVVLFVAVLPSLGVGGKRLFRFEAPGPSQEGLQPQIRETARLLWYIYLGMTVIQVVALVIAGMTWFDAICHTFGTLATGGFSTMNASVGAYPQPAIRVIIVVFMVLAGANFGLYYHVLRGRTGVVLRDVELRVYLGLLAVATILVWMSLLGAGREITMTHGGTLPLTPGNAFSEAVFTTVSIQTTTGFCTSDFDRWPFLAHAVLIALMLIGGCAGSTAGGIKVIRIWIAFRVMLAEIERVFRPQVVRTLKVGGGKIDAELKLGTLAYALGIVLLFATGSCAIMLLESVNPTSTCSYTTAATASIATLCTIGPGLDMVGATQNYGWFGAPSKYVMCMLMALGRLEVFAIIVLLTPRFWSTD